MDKAAAQRLVRETLQGSFNKERFVSLIKNLLNHVEEAPFTYKGQYIFADFQDSIKLVERIGKYKDSDEKLFDILVIHLQKETSLERARTKQRNFVAKYLKGSRGGVLKDAALVAFVTPDGKDWRFSFIKMEYKFEKGKVKEEFTPARRYSFLVGKNENSHTAQSRLLPLLLDDEGQPTLQALEDAFSIEKTTREFFEKYRALFIRLKENLDKIVKKDPRIKAEFDNKKIDTVDFAKNLLGQIVFLYFLQKKGWFGVGRDDDWDSGSKHFLRELFQKKHADYKNFFNDILEPLFYEALRNDRSHDDDYYSRFNCKIPFLNGGLFDPIGHYDWVHTDIDLPNALFSNTQLTKEGDTGDGILDVFDRYNFTVREDEPLEKEVAIDPELLGKAYEKFNAIRPDNFDEYLMTLKSGNKGEENKFNKKYGVYYTPREIVHYMCQQSLINYLATELEDQIDKNDLVTLIHTGEQVSENEARVLREGRETDTYSHKLPGSVCIPENAALIDQKLSAINVCDPAVGSGAFPVGMMNEIVRARRVVSLFLNDKTRNDYEYKRHCIEHSLYGVDIDPGAVEIAKLRLWLSLVVDETDIKNIKPLPNLDYRIMQGNSLLTEFMGINFDADEPRNSAPLMFKDKTDELIEMFQQKKEEFLNESNVSRKAKLKEKVENLLLEIFETKLRTQRADYFNQLENIENKYAVLPNQKDRDEMIKKGKEKLRKTSGFDPDAAKRQLKELSSERRIKPFFLWSLYFSEVFLHKGGFDVTIGNPPYVRADSGKRHLELRQSIKDSKQYETLWEKWDLYIPFIERSYKLLKQSGFTTMIVSDAYCHSKYAQKSQNWFLQNSRILRLDFFSKIQIFEAAVRNVTYLFQKADGSHQKPERRVHDPEFGVVKSLLTDEQCKLTYRAFFPEDADLPQFSSPTVPLNKICYISVGMVVHADEKRAQGEFELKDLVADEQDERHPKSFVEGKHLERWLPAENKWLEWGTKRAPDLFRRPTFPAMYEVGEKLISVDMATGVEKLCVAYDDQRLYHNHSAWSFVPWHSLSGVRNRSIKKSTRYRDEKPKHPDLPQREELEKTSRCFAVKFLLGVMNSTAAHDFLRANRRSNIHLYPDDWKKLPIPDVTSEQQEPIIELVNQILNDKRANPNADVSALEAQFDQLVYKLYGLTTKENALIK